MTISEKKMQIVIDNYFKSECDVNTSIRQAFEKGFRIGIKKGQFAEPKQDREFINLTVRNSNGRPLYSIVYLEVDDNGVGHDFEGYSSYSLDVISDYLKKYFMLSTESE